MFSIMLGAGLHRDTGETQSTLPVQNGQKPHSLVHSPLQTNVCPTSYKSRTYWFKMYHIEVHYLEDLTYSGEREWRGLKKVWSVEHRHDS